MLAVWVVGMLREDFGITENDVVKMKQVNDACSNSWNRTIFGNGKCTNVEHEKLHLY